MGFLLKAGFWVGVVLLFLPREHGQITQPRIVSEISTTSVVDLASAGMNLCQRQPAVCEAAVKTGGIGKEIFGSVTSHFLHTQADKKEKSDPRS